MPNNFELYLGYLTEEGTINKIDWNDSERFDFWNYQLKALNKGAKLLSGKDMYKAMEEFLKLELRDLPELITYYYLSVADIYFLTDIQPTCSLELNDKTNKNKICLKLEQKLKEPLLAAPKITVSNLYLDSDAEQKILLSVEGYNPETAGYNQISFGPTADGFKNSSTGTTYYLLREEFFNTNIQYLSSEGTLEESIYTGNVSKMGINLKPGTYKFNVTFYNFGEPVAISPTTISIKLEKRKAVKGSFKPATNYTINTISGNAALSLEELVKQEIAFDGGFTGSDVQIEGVSTRTLTVDKVQMVNTKGSFNKFFDYFEWDEESGNISLKDTITADDLAYLKNELKNEKGKVIKSDADRKCYITYTATYGMNTNGLPFTVTKTVLVTINLK